MTPEQSAEIIEAVRNHPEIGRGSCSYVDETMSDEEVLEELQEADLNTPARAIAHLVRVEQICRSVFEDRSAYFREA